MIAFHIFIGERSLDHLRTWQLLALTSKWKTFLLFWNLFLAYREINIAHICYMVTSLVSLQQVNVKKSEKSMKIVNIEGVNLHIFWKTWGNTIKFSGKTWLIIISKVTKKQGFTFSLENKFLEKIWPHREGSNWFSLAFFRVKQCADTIKNDEEIRETFLS